MLRPTELRPAQSSEVVHSDISQVSFWKEQKKRIKMASLLKNAHGNEEENCWGVFLLKKGPAIERKSIQDASISTERKRIVLFVTESGSPAGKKEPEEASTKSSLTECMHACMRSLCENKYFKAECTHNRDSD